MGGWWGDKVEEAEVWSVKWISCWCAWDCGGENSPLINCVDESSFVSVLYPLQTIYINPSKIQNLSPQRSHSLQSNGWKPLVSGKERSSKRPPACRFHVHLAIEGELNLVIVDPKGLKTVSRFFSEGRRREGDDDGNFVESRNEWQQASKQKLQTPSIPSPHPYIIYCSRATHTISDDQSLRSYCTPSINRTEKNHL